MPPLSRMQNGVAIILAELVFGLAFGSPGHAFRARLWVEAGDLDRYTAAPVELSIGSRTQMAILDFRTALTLVVDRRCGQLPPNRHCPAFCNDAQYAALYCHPLCRKLNENNIRLICGNQNSASYDSATSATFRDSNRTDVREQYQSGGHMRPMWGLWGEERIGFPGWFKAPNISGVPFVRAVMFDNRLTDRMHWGLKPKARDGTPSLIPQLHQLGAIPRAAISIGRSRVDWFRSAKSIHDNFIRLHTVTVGGLDSAFCYDWALSRAETNSWDFWIDDVVFMGVKIPGRTLARFNLVYYQILVHQAVARAHIASGLLNQKFEFQYVAFCDLPVTLSFKINGTLFEFGHLDLTYKPVCRPEQRALYLTKLGRAPESRYPEEEAWEFGQLILEKFCFGFDYTAEMTAWGRKRRIIDDDFY